MDRKLEIIDCIQGSEQWHKIRCGLPTSSDFHKIITTQGKRSTQREKYLYKLAGEAVAGQTEDSYISPAMQRGTELESEARAFYEFTKDVEVEQVGFCKLGEIGCSPDGLIGKDGGLEIKCPTIGVHVFYMHSHQLPTEYFAQVQGSLYVTGREWWEFMSYSTGIRPFIIRVYPDKEFFKHLERELNDFLEDLEFIKKEIS